MCKENKARITKNLENVAKHLPSDRLYAFAVINLMIFLILD